MSKEGLPASFQARQPPEAVPATLPQIQLTPADTLSHQDTPMLIYDNNLPTNRLIVLASPLALQMLSKSLHWASDGTFSSSPNLFSQELGLKREYEERVIVNGRPGMSRTKKHIKRAMNLAFVLSNLAVVPFNKNKTFIFLLFNYKNLHYKTKHLRIKTYC